MRDPSKHKSQHSGEANVEPYSGKERLRKGHMYALKWLKSGEGDSSIHSIPANLAQG